MAVSATLAINQLTADRLAAGRPVLPLGFGEAGLPVHPDLVAALSAAAATGSSGGYGPVVGFPALREAAAGYWRRRCLPTTAAQVVAGPGSKPLLYAVLRASVGGVALPRPSWVSYAAQAQLLGREVHHVPTPDGQGGVPDPDLLDAAAASARAAGRPIGLVVLTLPDNPTGTLAGSGTIRAVADVARRHDLLIVSDEIYRDLVHDPIREFLSPAELAPERTVVTTGLSKNLALGGWRIGVARMPEGPLGNRLGAEVAAIASEVWSSPANPVQQAAAWAFEEPEQLTERIAASRSLHARVATAVADRFAAAGAAVHPPSAAFYLYPDFSAYAELLADRWSVRTGTDLATLLLDSFDVATLPGAAFGDQDERLSLRVATSMLYGEGEQREKALTAADPVALPWVAGRLDQLDAALGRLLDGG
ncbi:pyridoxal phosphate-dependent aminotransferase [Actinopolymorpha rutila]|uniref:Aminotransferase n=1 Tax=Actinopolymorpha rutila TaxID=446787 RepID=A0A852ZRA5_9ACTN|nr:pyridoxal phosphate-dependent aminotransferase [Actinopolymorpha rutila]NYH91929.1 aspartate aminotransferase [Actinopolymorpha rutila]